MYSERSGQVQFPNGGDAWTAEELATVLAPGTFTLGVFSFSKTFIRPYVVLQCPNVGGFSERLDADILQIT